MSIWKETSLTKYLEGSLNAGEEREKNKKVRICS